MFNTGFNEVETDCSDSEEEIKACLESRKLAVKHVGYPIRELKNGFDVIKSKESQIVLGHYRITYENG